MQTAIYEKTDKGREEIATRKYRLAPRLRALLLLIDGQRDAADVLHTLADLGLTIASVEELLDRQLIAPARSGPSPAGAPAMARADSEAKADTAYAQFRALYQFYTRTIKSTIGLRGFSLQLKVERAASLQELRALRDSYLEAVVKARGSDAALELAAELDGLTMQH